MYLLSFKKYLLIKNLKYSAEIENSDNEEIEYWRKWDNLIYAIFKFD
jgi:hypothetical protein